MNYGTMKQRIADEMRRGDLTVCATVVASSIISAIEYFKRRRFYFNEFLDTTFSASASVTAVSLSSDVIAIDSLKVVIGNRNYPLEPMGWKEMDAIDSGQFFGYPDYYAIHSGMIRFYPPPNGNYVIRMSGIRELPEVTLDATTNATNAWVDTVDGEAMIRAKAKAYLFRDFLRDQNQARIFDSQAELEAREIARENRAKIGSGRVKCSW